MKRWLPQEKLDQTRKHLSNNTQTPFIAKAARDPASWPGRVQQNDAIWRDLSFSSPDRVTARRQVIILTTLSSLAPRTLNPNSPGQRRAEHQFSLMQKLHWISHSLPPRQRHK